MPDKRHEAIPNFHKRFPRNFFNQDTLVVAEKLIGAILVSIDTEGNLTAGRIVETEAYCGPEDKGAHTYNGRRTARNEAMYGEKGHAYIYLIYGMYWCVNVVSGPKGKAQAVLIRGIEPIAGRDKMRERVSAKDSAADWTLGRGPGKLCKALGLSKDHYGLDYRGKTLFLIPNELFEEESIGVSPRINIDYADEWKDAHYRFYIKNNKSVSGPSYLRR